MKRNITHGFSALRIDQSFGFCSALLCSALFHARCGLLVQKKRKERNASPSPPIVLLSSFPRHGIFPAVGSSARELSPWHWSPEGPVPASSADIWVVDPAIETFLEGLALWEAWRGAALCITLAFTTT